MTVLLIITIGNEISLVKKEREYEQEIDKTLSYINTISENVLLFDGHFPSLQFWKKAYLKKCRRFSIREKSQGK